MWSCLPTSFSKDLVVAPNFMGHHDYLVCFKLDPFHDFPSSPNGSLFHVRLRHVKHYDTFNLMWKSISGTGTLQACRFARSGEAHTAALLPCSRPVFVTPTSPVAASSVSPASHFLSILASTSTSTYPLVPTSGFDSSFLRSELPRRPAACLCSAGGPNPAQSPPLTPRPTSRRHRYRITTGTRGHNQEKEGTDCKGAQTTSMRTTSNGEPCASPARPLCLRTSIA
jgi:hypothetical protein